MPDEFNLAYLTPTWDLARYGNSSLRDPVSFDPFTRPRPRKVNRGPVRRAPLYFGASCVTDGGAPVSAPTERFQATLLYPCRGPRACVLRASLVARLVPVSVLQASWLSLLGGTATPCGLALRHAPPFAAARV